MIIEILYGMLAFAENDREFIICDQGRAYILKERLKNMKRIGFTGDYPAWTYIGEIMDEMQAESARERLRHGLAVSKDSLESLLLEKFPQVDIDLCFCFRCLDRDSGLVSKVRMWKNDSPNSFNKINNISECDRTLGFDMIVYREDFSEIKNNKAAQKLMLGNEMLRFIKLKLPNYTKKIPMTKDETNDILTTIEDWLVKNNWVGTFVSDDECI